MATIVELSNRHPDRYSRKFGDVGEAGAEVLLFTGVRYERSEDVDLDGAVDDLERVLAEEAEGAEIGRDPLKTVR